MLCFESRAAPEAVQSTAAELEIVRSLWDPEYERGSTDFLLGLRLWGSSLLPQNFVSILLSLFISSDLYPD